VFFGARLAGSVSQAAQQALAAEVDMWIFTTFGFFSVVQKKPTDEFLTVRARDPKDLDRLRERIPELGPTKLTGSDYACRAQVRRGAFAAGLAKIVHEIDYPNFKDTVEKEMGKERAHIYFDVWMAASKIQHK
jgi:hypothetical protein